MAQTTPWKCWSSRDRKRRVFGDSPPPPLVLRSTPLSSLTTFFLNRGTGWLVLNRYWHDLSVMTALRLIASLLVNGSLMVSTLGFATPKTSIASGSEGFLGAGWQGGGGDGLSSLPCRQKTCASMRLGVSVGVKTGINLCFNFQLSMLCISQTHYYIVIK